MKTGNSMILAIELSSAQGSVALLQNGALLAEKTWESGRLRHNAVFQEMETLMKEAGLSYGDLSLYAAGRGPGSFSGMRMGFAVAQALALPGRTEVRAVSSGSALALAAAREAGAGRIAVAGDARRGQVWIGLFSAAAPTGSGPEWVSAAVVQNEDWKLVPYGELVIPAGTLVVSPDADRLREYIPQLGDPRFPHARDVAELAQRQLKPEPPEPLYMHPPVFVPPKYLEN